MANNSTAANDTTFILPQWLLPKEPGMSCRPHGTIIGMLALYNIISTVLSVIIAGPFFFHQKQQIWSFAGQAFGRCWRCISRRRNQESTESVDPDTTSYAGFSFWSFTMSVLGSIAISLSAPLLTGILISRSRPTANRWVLIEQWSTRPRATMFVVLANLIATCSNYKKVVGEDIGALGREPGHGHVETSITTVATELVVSFFGIKFLWDQTSIPSPDEFPSSSPCTFLGSPLPYGDPSNCPDMQIGAYGLIQAIIFNGFLSVIFLIFLAAGGVASKEGIALFCTLPFTGFIIYMYSWKIWANFLHSASDDLYCIEASTPIDVIYCLLPVLLGLWRLAWSGRRGNGGY